jgi:hypothetical protein
MVHSNHKDKDLLDVDVDSRLIIVCSGILTAPNYALLFPKFPIRAECQELALILSGWDQAQNSQQDYS